MICPFCGASLLDNAKFCEECGAEQYYSSAAPGFGQQPNYQQPNYQQPNYQQPNYQQPNYQQPNYQQPNYQQPAYGQSRAGMGESQRAGEPESPIYTSFGTAVKLFFHNWNNFKGRSTRSEYWYAYLFQMIISFAISMVTIVPYGILGYLVSLVFFVPSLAVSIRRLHDIGKSGWWYLIVFTCVGAFVLLYWYSQPGSPVQNEFGPSAEELDMQNPMNESNFNSYNNYNQF